MVVAPDVLAAVDEVSLPVGVAVGAAASGFPGIAAVVVGVLPVPVFPVSPEVAVGAAVS